MYKNIHKFIRIYKKVQEATIIDTGGDRERKRDRKRQRERERERERDRER